MVEIPTQGTLTLPQSPVVSGDTFLLPVCIDSAALNDLISYYFAGVYSKYEYTNPELRMTGIWPVLEAMAFVDRPGESACGAVLPDEGSCVDYPTNAGWISYAPNDPYQTPDFTPEGYIVPPWYRNPLIPLPGVLPGDAMVNGLALPIFSEITDSFNWPRFEIEVNGTGEVEVELVKIPQGGYAAVTTDNDLLTAQFVDLNSLDIGAIQTILDILGIVVSASQFNTETIEIQFDTPGVHTIYVQFLPKILDGTLLGFGGGLRRVGLCAGAEIGSVDVPEIRTIDDGCTLQWRPNDIASWVTLSTSLCGEDGADGIPGIPGAAGASVELRVVGNHLQWRQDDDSPTWAFLYDLSDLAGADGQDGQDGVSFGDFISPSYRCSIASAMATRWVTNVDNAIAYALAQAAGVPQAVYQNLMGWSPANIGTPGVATNMDALTNVQCNEILTYVRLSTTIPAWTCIILDSMNDAGSVDGTAAAIRTDINAHITGNMASGTARTVLQSMINATGQDNLNFWTWLGWQLGDPGAISSNCDPCMTETGDAWGKSYNFATGSRSTSFTYGNATRVASSGYRQTSGAAPVTFQTSDEVYALRVQVRVTGGIGDSGTLKLIDLRTGDTIMEESVSFTFEAVNQVFTWEGENLPFIERGFRVEWDGNDEGDGSSQFVHTICILGISLIIPPEGADSGCSDV